MVEFAAVLMPLVLILVGIIQFGFLFGSYVNTSNAAREGARAGTVHVYNTAQSTAQNDLARCEAVLAAVNAAIAQPMPGSFAGSCATSAGGGDLAVTYPDSATCTASTRSGCRIDVAVTYRQPIFVPLVEAFLGSGGTVTLTANVTMVVN